MLAGKANVSRRFSTDACRPFIDMDRDFGSHVRATSAKLRQSRSVAVLDTSRGLRKANLHIVLGPPWDCT